MLYEVITDLTNTQTMQTVIQGDDIHMEELARMTAAMELLRKRINKGMPGQQMS